MVARVALRFPVNGFLALGVLFVRVVCGQDMGPIPYNALHFVRAASVFLVRKFRAKFFVEARRFRIVGRIRVLCGTRFLYDNDKAAFMVIGRIVQWQRNFVFVRDRVADVYRPIAIGYLIVCRGARELLQITFVLCPISDVVDGGIHGVSVFLGDIVVLHGRVQVMMIALSESCLPMVGTKKRTFGVPFARRYYLVTSSLRRLQRDLLQAIGCTDNVVVRFVNTAVLSYCRANTAKAAWEVNGGTLNGACAINDGTIGVQYFRMTYIMATRRLYHIVIYRCVSSVR